jgi:thiol-disulfide isomerase/thioredoxin
MYNSFIPQSEALRKQKAVSDSLKLHDASEKEIEKAAFIYDSLYFRYFRYNTAFADTTVSATAVFYALFRYFSDTGHINISANVERAVLRFDTITPIKALLQDYNISKNSHTALNNDEVLDIDKYFSDEMMIGIKRALKSKKLILVDFWASWCVPCREEFPFLNEAYEKFQGSGFDIISISLDSKKELWEKSVSSSALLWSNQFWDKDAWESKTVKTLNIKSIPRNYLIDEKGKIYAKDLRGPELMVILKRLL